MPQQTLGWWPAPKREQVNLGFCSTHPKVPAVVTEKKVGEPKRRFCGPCWLDHKRNDLKLPECIFAIACKREA